MLKSAVQITRFLRLVELPDSDRIDSLAGSLCLVAGGRKLV